MLEFKQKYKKQESIKIVLLGGSGCGKSAFAERLTKDQFSGNLEATSCFNRSIFHSQKDNTHYVSELFDTAGQERFDSITKTYVKNKQLALIAYDVSHKKSLERAIEWSNYIHDENLKNEMPISQILIGMKSDLGTHRQVSYEEGKKVAEKIGASCFFECSSKSSAGIEEIKEAIMTIFKKQLENTLEEYIQKNTVSVNISSKKEKKIVEIRENLQKIKWENFWKLVSLDVLDLPDYTQNIFPSKDLLDSIKTGYFRSSYPFIHNVVVSVLEEFYVKVKTKIKKIEFDHVKFEDFKNFSNILKLPCFSELEEFTAVSSNLTTPDFKELLTIKKDKIRRINLSNNYIAVRSTMERNELTNPQDVFWDCFEIIEEWNELHECSINLSNNLINLDIDSLDYMLKKCGSLKIELGLNYISEFSEKKSKDVLNLEIFKEYGSIISGPHDKMTSVINKNYKTTIDKDQWAVHLQAYKQEEHASLVIEGLLAYGQRLLLVVDYHFEQVSEKIIKKLNLTDFQESVESRHYSSYPVDRNKAELFIKEFKSGVVKGTHSKLAGYYNTSGKYINCLTAAIEHLGIILQDEAVKGMLQKNLTSTFIKTPMNYVENLNKAREQEMLEKRETLLKQALEQHHDIIFLSLKERVFVKYTYKRLSSECVYTTDRNLFQLLEKNPQKDFFNCLWGVYSYIKDIYHTNKARDDINPVYIVQLNPGLKAIYNSDNLENYKVLGAFILNKDMQPIVFEPKEQEKAIRQILHKQKTKDIETEIKALKLGVLTHLETLFTPDVYGTFLAEKGISAFTWALQCSSLEIIQYIFKQDKNRILNEIKINDGNPLKEGLELLIFKHVGKSNQQDKLRYLEELFNQEIFGKKLLWTSSEKEIRLIFSICVYNGLEESAIKENIQQALEDLKCDVHSEIRSHFLTYYAVAAGADKALAFLLGGGANFFAEDKLYHDTPVILAKKLEVENEASLPFQRAAQLLQDKKSDLIKNLFNAIKNENLIQIKNIITQYTTNKKCHLLTEKFADKISEDDASEYYPLFYAIKHFKNNKDILNYLYKQKPSLINETIKLHLISFGRPLPVNVWQMAVFTEKNKSLLPGKLSVLIKLFPLNENFRPIINFIISPNKKNFERLTTKYAKSDYIEKTDGYYLTEYLAAGGVEGTTTSIDYCSYLLEIMSKISDLGILDSTYEFIKNSTTVVNDLHQKIITIIIKHLKETVVNSLRKLFETRRNENLHYDITNTNMKEILGDVIVENNDETSRFFMDYFTLSLTNLYDSIFKNPKKITTDNLFYYLIDFADVVFLPDENDSARKTFNQLYVKNNKKFEDNEETVTDCIQTNKDFHHYRAILSNLAKKSFRESKVKGLNLDEQHYENFNNLLNTSLEKSFSILKEKADLIEFCRAMVARIIFYQEQSIDGPNSQIKEILTILELLSKNFSEKWLLFGTREDKILENFNETAKCLLLINKRGFFSKKEQEELINKGKYAQKEINVCKNKKEVKYSIYIDRKIMGRILFFACQDMRNPNEEIDNTLENKFRFKVIKN